jgi:hypothetical protein
MNRNLDEKIRPDNYVDGLHLPHNWTFSHSTAFLYLCCALQDPPAKEHESEVQTDYEAVSEYKSTLTLDLASRHLEEIIQGEAPGKTLAQAASKHSVFVTFTRDARELAKYLYAMQMANLVKETGTVPKINESVLGLCRNLWSAAEDAARMHESGQPITAAQVQDDAARRLEWQMQMWDWTPSARISWKHSRRICRPSLFERIGSFFSS